MTQSEIILTGAGGQLGLTIQKLWPQSPLASQFTLTPFTSAELDISDEQAVNRVLNEKINDRIKDRENGAQIAAIINAAAYTAVDAAEDPANRDTAFAVNETGAANLASWAKQNHARVLHVSTDFVFSGEKKSPYAETDPTAPLGVYGASKLAGEQALLERLPDASVIVRTSWLYSPYRNNFAKTMLRLMAERDELNIVDDQIGSPTSTESLAQLLFRMIQAEGASGVYHWSDGASISWYDFAVAIQQAGLREGLLQGSIKLNPIPSSAYPTPAKRPAYSVLDTSKAQKDFGMQAQDWQENLGAVIAQLAASKV